MTTSDPAVQSAVAMPFIWVVPVTVKQLPSNPRVRSFALATSAPLDRLTLPETVKIFLALSHNNDALPAIALAPDQNET